MSDPLRWGILGNANIARVCVIPAIQKSTNGTVHALATRSPAAAREVLARNRIPRVYDSYQALVDDPNVDALYIPLPNHLHHPWTLKALSAGKHVLCEKPLACNAREARDMADRAEESGRLLMEAFMYRFHPRNLAVYRLLRDGEIGKPRLIRSAFCYFMAEDQLASRRNTRMLPEMGGGALLDVGCYCVSLARWMMGAEPTEVQAQAFYHPGGVDMHLAATLRFDDLALAGLEASFVAALQQTYSIIGTDGAVELPHDAFIPWEKETIYTVRRRDQENGRQIAVPGADEYQLMVEHFGDVLTGHCPPMVPAHESIANMRVLDALAVSGRSGKSVKVEQAIE
jgi:predicted dehydrogenase